MSNKEEMYTRSLNAMRRKIDSVDKKIIELLARRMRISRKIGELKSRQDAPSLDETRKSDMLRDRAQRSVSGGLDAEFSIRLFEMIHDESLKQQK